MTTYLLVLLAALTLADHVSTNVFLKRGLTEANPLLAKVIALWGTTGLFAFKVLALGFIVIFAGLPDWALAVLCAVYASVVAWNIYQVTK